MSSTVACSFGNSGVKLRELREFRDLWGGVTFEIEPFWKPPTLKWLTLYYSAYTVCVLALESPGC
eukprot:1581160-Amphidinium_carterae.1